MLLLIQTCMDSVPNVEQNTEFRREIKPKSEGMNQKTGS